MSSRPPSWNLTKRVWAFIVDLALVGILVGIAWAPLVLAVGAPLRFEPVLPIVSQERTCELIASKLTRGKDGAETSVREEFCTTTYAGLWENRDHVREERTIRGKIPTGKTITYTMISYPVDGDGNPQLVINDGLITILVLMVYFTLLEGSASGMTLGKLLFGMKVVGAHGQPVTRGIALGRNLVKLSPFAAMYAASLWMPPLGAFLGLPLASLAGMTGLAFGVIALGGFAMALVTARRQAFHDLLSGTFVTRES